MKKRIVLNRILTVLVLGSVSGIASFAMSGCNTVEGVGRDVESAGDAIADTARDAKD